MTMTMFLVASAVLVGACVGSFLNVCIHRLPREGLSVARPRRSFCPACEQPIPWYDNLPILSWLLLRGHCRSCGAPIAVRYPLVEGLTAALFGVAMFVGLDEHDLLRGLATGCFWALLLAALVVVTFVDLEHRIIPDAVSITGAAIAPVGALFLPAVPIFQEQPALLATLLERLDRGLAPDAGWGLCAAVAVIAGCVTAVLFRRHSPRWDGGRRGWWETRLAFSVGALGTLVIAGLLLVPDWWQQPAARRLVAALLGMATGAGFLYGIGVLGRLAFRKDAMGLGDVKLMALLGAVLGWQGALLAVFLASLLGSVIGILVKLVTRSSYIPFGPFLSAGGVLLILWPEGIEAAWRWYLGFFPR